MTSEVFTILGGPGAGKTEYLLKCVENALLEGWHPDTIAYASYTKKAAQEAKQRAVEKFRLSYDDLPYFGTIHSLCYHELNLGPTQVMTSKDYKVVLEHLGYPVGENGSEGGPPLKLDGMIQLAEASMLTLREVWEMSDGDVNYWEVERYAETVKEYKNDLGKLDFNDMLTLYTSTCISLPIGIAVIDEAQDLSRAQWTVIDHMMKRAKRIYLGGDDDQAIYRWSGADVDQFQERARHSKITVLKQSHRLPKDIFNLSLQVLKQINDRIPKELHPVEKDGSIEYLNEPTEIDLVNDQSWYLLARNKVHLTELKRLCVEQGVAYWYENQSSVDDKHLKAILGWEGARAKREISDEQKDLAIQYKDKQFELGADVLWHDALTGIHLDKREYYLSIRHNKEKLLKEPRVTVGTMHSVKGGEAQNVLVLTDVNYRSHESLWKHGDDEHRVFYVAITRSMQNLFVVLPRSQYSYPALY